MKVLILGGVTEAYSLAEALVRLDAVQVITSLAGRTHSPRMPSGETRIGGFGGVAGLATYLRDGGIGAVIDATHPFAAGMGWNAHEGCQLVEVPLLRLERPAWTPEPEDRWTLVEGWEQAVAALGRGGSRRALLAVGRQELAPFVKVEDVWFLIRVVTPPDPSLAFRSSQVLLSRGPFDLESERALLDTHMIDTIVCKNSGGEATHSKLVAARERGIQVIMRQRLPRPEQPTVATVDEALAWLIAGIGSG